MAQARRGAFILFEGIDRCGKSTQAKAVAAGLRGEGYAVEEMRFPDRTTTIGKLIDAYLRESTEVDDHAIHLLFAANRWEAASAIEATLAAGTSLVVDRYSYSGMVFTGAKGLPLEWCAAPEIGLPKPDIVVHMDISLASAAARGGYGEERYEKEEMQRKVHAAFAQLAADDPAVWHVCDADRDPQVITEELVAHLSSVIDGVGDSPLNRM